MNTESITEYLSKRFSTFPEDKVAVIEYPSGRCLTYGQLNTQTIAVASALYKRGFGRDQYLSHFGSNVLENAPIGYGVMATGGTIDLIKPSVDHKELVFHLCLVRPRFVVTTDDRVSLIMSALNEATIEVEEIFVIGSATAHCQSAQILLEDPGDANPIGKVEIKDDEDVAALLQTGGTTGMSKSVMVLHKSLKILCSSKFIPCWTGKDNVLSYTPFGYITSLICYMVNGNYGGTVISLQKFDADESLRAIVKYKVTAFIIGHAPVSDMIHSSIFDTCDVSSLKWAIMAGSPISKEIEAIVKERFKKLAPDLTFYQLYGMTEAAICVTSFTEEDIKRKDKAGSCGKFLSFVTAKVVSPLDERIVLKPGERGHIILKIPTLMKGYFRNEEATAKALKDGWYHTQDYGLVDEEGFVFVMDRIDELIVKQSGVIVPSELETVIKSHPKINECVVLSKTIDGEKWPIAFAIRNDDNVTSEEIQQFVANKVELFSQLKGGVRFVTEIPKSLAGKLLRKKFLAEVDEN